MGRSKDKNFKNRFGERIVVTYPDRPLSLIEQKAQDEKVFKAFTQVLSGILDREPSPNELFGLEQIMPKKKKFKQIDPP